MVESFSPSILPAVWQVPARFRERLGTGPGRQRAMAHDGHLLLVLHAPPGPDDVERRGRFFWREPDGAWHATEAGSGQAALARHIEEYAELLEALDRRNAQARAADEYLAVLNAVAPLHRAARNMHHALQQAREQIPNARDVIDFRDRAYAVERMADLLHADARSAVEIAMARRAEEQARASHHMAVSAHRLNLLAAFFFPLATLSALFGINLQHGLETYDAAHAPWPFLIVLGVGCLCGMVLTSFIIGRPRDK
ncbi:MAG: CorA family divalent cation transporter [Planctomycetes bacterium]|nr:CorA family divalent cation transporter [Planctomycetota bacterium]